MLEIIKQLLGHWLSFKQVVVSFKTVAHDSRAPAPLTLMGAAQATYLAVGPWQQLMAVCQRQLEFNQTMPGEPLMHREIPHAAQFTLLNTLLLSSGCPGAGGGI